MPNAASSYFDKDVAIRLATACALAQDLFKDPKASPPAGYEFVAPPFTVRVLGQDEVFGYAMSSRDDAVLAFRGGESLPDFLADVSYAQVRYPFVSGAGRTHGGFTALYQSCRNAIQAALLGLPTRRPLFITGHSLGGALATVAALDAAISSPFAKPIVYTFGSPRVGDPAFADAFDARVADSWRVINAFDIVPLLPPEQIYDALQQRYFHYQHISNKFPIAFRKGGILANHRLVNYLGALQTL